MNRTPPELPVEPLSSDTWSRIEDRLVERLAQGDVDAGPSVPATRRRHVVLWGGAALAAAAAAALVLWLGAPASAPQATPLTVQRISAGGDGATAQVGDVDVRVGPRSRMTVVGDGARGYVVVLEAGRARFDVPPRGERPPFRVHAGATRVEVVGTVFEVTLGAGEAAGVRVEHGTVRVSDPRGTRLLTAGQRIAADPRDDGGPTAATTEPPSTLGPAAAPAEPRPRATHRVPVGEVHPPPAPDAEAATSPGHPEAVEAATPPRAAPATEPSRQALYERAARLERAEPGASLALYRSLADGDDAWARLALFAAGRLAHEQARQGEARRLLERYLARYPEGPNAADAHAILER